MSKIVYALDYSALKEARKAMRLLRNDVGMFKIGLELFTAEGRKAINLGKEFGLPIFLDLKLHDIPATVEKTVGVCAKLGVKILTVHCMGGTAMLNHAVKCAENTGMSIAAVTILTSLDSDKDFESLCLPPFRSYLTCKYAQTAYNEGVRTFVCSPKELQSLRDLFGNSVTLISPGIRLPKNAEITWSANAGISADDQKAIGTPQHAGQYADWIVVGRLIRFAANPVAMAKFINSTYGV
jgi:orotidine-5'-phosphate decarboxylase